MNTSWASPCGDSTRSVDSASRRFVRPVRGFAESTHRAYLCPVKVPTPNRGARLKRESGSTPELSPQLYASHRGGPHTPLFAVGFQVENQLKNGKAAHSAEQARRPARTFTGSAFAEDEWRKRAAAAFGPRIYKLFFGLGPAVVSFQLKRATAGFESNFLHRKFDSDAFFIF